MMILSATINYKRSQGAFSFKNDSLECIGRREILMLKLVKLQEQFHLQQEISKDLKRAEDDHQSRMQQALDAIKEVQSTNPKILVDGNDGSHMSAVTDSKSLFKLRTLQLEKEIEDLKAKIADCETENAEQQRFVIDLNRTVKDREVEAKNQTKEIEYLKFEAAENAVNSKQTLDTLEYELKKKAEEIGSSQQTCKHLETQVLNNIDRQAKLDRKYGDESVFLKHEIQYLKRAVEVNKLQNDVLICDLKEKLTTKENELQHIYHLQSKTFQDLTDRNQTISALNEIVQLKNDWIESLKETCFSLEQKIELDELRCNQLETIIQKEVEDHEEMKQKFRQELLQKHLLNENNKLVIRRLLDEKETVEESLVKQTMELKEGVEREEGLKESNDRLVIENQESFLRESKLIEVNNKLVTDNQILEDLKTKNKLLEQALSDQHAEHEKQLIAAEEGFSSENEVLENEKKDLEQLLNKQKSLYNDLTQREKNLLKENNRIVLKNEALRKKSGKLDELLSDERNKGKERKEYVEDLGKAKEKLFIEKNDLEKDNNQKQDMLDKHNKQYEELSKKCRELNHANDTSVAEKQHLKARFEVKTIECQKLVCKIGQLRKEISSRKSEMRKYQLTTNKMVISKDTFIEESKVKISRLMQAVKTEKLINQVLLKDTQEAKEKISLKETELTKLKLKLDATKDHLEKVTEQLNKLANEKSNKIRKHKEAKKRRSKEQLETLKDIKQSNDRKEAFEQVSVIKKGGSPPVKSNTILTKIDAAQHKVARQQNKASKESLMRNDVVENKDIKSCLKEDVSCNCQTKLPSEDRLKETSTNSYLNIDEDGEGGRWRCYVTKLILACIFLYAFSAIVFSLITVVV